jgi:hypothetical protein
MVVVV